MALIRPRRAWRIAAAALALAVTSMAVASEVTPEDGRRAYDAGHFTDAMGIWAELSRQGNAEAQFGLGLLYDLGNGTPANPETAFFWYKAAAEAGLPAAEFNVAAMYDGGRGVPQSTETAALWYAKAAARGHHRAQFDLGLLYEKGIGVPRNPGAAAAWMRDAADGGITAASARLKAIEAAIPDKPTGELQDVTLVFPSRNTAFATTSSTMAVELVWTAPPEPRPVHYEVQVRELDGESLRTVLTASVTETATLVPLPAGADFYIWSVDTVGRDGRRTVGDWTWFSIGAPTPSETVASGRGAAQASR